MGGRRQRHRQTNKRAKQDPAPDLSRFAGSSEEDDDDDDVEQKRNKGETKQKGRKRSSEGSSHDSSARKKTKRDTTKPEKEARVSSGNDRCASQSSETKQREVRLRGGVVIRDIAIGKGARANSGASVSITYIGSIPRADGGKGKVFDKNLNPNHPLKFVMGAGEVIKGLDIGMENMQVGGERVITIPPSLGYGAQGAGPKIPGGSTLQFRVKLVSSSNPGAVLEF